MPRRIRVLFVIGTMSGGGAERQILEIIRLIDRTRFEPMLYLSTREGELLDNVPTDVPTFAYRDPLRESWWQRIGRRAKLSPLLRYLHLANVLRRQGIDVVYDRTYRATLDASGATRIRPTPRVSCCVVDPQPELELHAQGRNSLIWRLARSAYRRANLILVNSEGLHDRLVEYFQLPFDQIEVCRNLVDMDRLDQLAQESIPTVSTDRFLIVTAGRLHAQKGHRYLLEAIDELVHRRKRSIQLVILGTGELRAQLTEFVDSHDLKDHVTFSGFVANPIPWYRQAQLFVLPSLYEGSPNALLEAVAIGTPVVSADCPSGPSEILESGRFGRLVPPADSLALVDAIEDAIDHYSKWQQHAIMARESIRQRYGARLGIKHVEACLHRVSKIPFHDTVHP